MYVLILDTETTGLFPRGGVERPPQTPSAPHTNNNKTPFNPSTQRGFKGDTVPLPYAVQISYAIMDTSSPFFPIVEDYDAIIRISETTPLPEESVKIHGITREIIRAKGVPIEHALSILQRSLDTYDIQLVVGHNIAFDLRVLSTEYARQAPPSTPPCIKGMGASSAPLRPPLCEGASSAPFNPSTQMGGKGGIAPSPSSSPDPTSTPNVQAGGLRGLCPLPDPTSTPGGDERPLQPLRDDKYLKKSPDQVQAGGLRGLCHLPHYCTARESVGVCNLRVDSMYGGTYLKFGKLGQVFEILFKERDAVRGVDMKVFEKYMHNSRVDVLMCARVYVWLCYSVDVFDAWYREMQNYADADFINVDDSHLVGGGGVERPFETPICGGGPSPPSTPRGAVGFKGALAAPCTVGLKGALDAPSPRRSDRLRLKRMLVQEQGSVLVM